MPQVIYTGQNYAQYQPSQGRALQALSQFAQQQQIREEQQLQRSREDRNLMASIMKLDPVYATRSKLQTMMGNIYDKWEDAQTLFSKEVEGRDLTTSDLVRGMQMQAEAMAEMQQIKATDTEIGQAYKMYLSNPGDFRRDMLLEGIAYSDKTGMVPEGG